MPKVVRLGCSDSAELLPWPASRSRLGCRTPWSRRPSARPASTVRGEPPYMPFTREMRRRYRAGDIGEIRYAEAEYLDEPADLAAMDNDRARWRARIPAIPGQRPGWPRPAGPGTAGRPPPRCGHGADAHAGRVRLASPSGRSGGGGGPGREGPHERSAASREQAAARRCGRSGRGDGRAPGCRRWVAVGSRWEHGELVVGGGTPGTNTWKGTADARVGDRLHHLAGWVRGR